jgi:hypothetical protein
MSASLLPTAVARGLSGELLAEIGVEVAAGSGWRDVAFADHEVAEAFACLALPGVALDQGRERADDLVVAEVLAIQLVQPRAVEGGLGFT